MSSSAWETGLTQQSGTANVHEKSRSGALARESALLFATGNITCDSGRLERGLSWRLRSGRLRAAAIRLRPAPSPAPDRAAQGPATSRRRVAAVEPAAGLRRTPRAAALPGRHPPAARTPPEDPARAQVPRAAARRGRPWLLPVAAGRRQAAPPGAAAGPAAAAAAAQGAAAQAAAAPGAAAAARGAAAARVAKAMVVAPVATRESSAAGSTRTGARLIRARSPPSRSTCPATRR